VPAQTTQPTSTALQRSSIAMVPAAAPVASAPPQSLSEILAERSHHFSKYDNAPLGPAPPPNKKHP
jgi:hypothetical protein